MAEMDAAQRLVADPQVPLPTAVIHLRRAWTHLVGSGVDEIERARAMARAAVDAHIGRDHREAQQRVVDWIFDDGAQGVEVPERSALVTHAGLLRSLLGPERALRDPTAAWGIAFLVLLAFALSFTGVWGLFRAGTGPWRARWYPEPGFAGSVRVEQAREVDFDWGKGSPVRGLPRDDWSARFDTCLLLDEETKVRFKLTSDDGSRLYVGEDEVIDNWGDHAPRSRTGVRTLGAGTHLLRIDYYEARYGAELVLEVAFGDEDYSRLPPKMLSRPGKDKTDPCSG